MEHDYPEQPGWVRLPGYDEDPRYPHGADDSRGYRRGAGARGSGVRRVRQASNWTAALLIAGVAADHRLLRAPCAPGHAGHQRGDLGARRHGGHRRPQAVPVRSGGHLQRLWRHRGDRAGRDPHRHLPGQLMAAMGPEGARDWCQVDVGATTVGVAERDALGTTARVVVWPPN